MRIHTIDSLRGLAIIIMIAANSWQYIYPYENYPIILRVIFSSAAPIFIFLNGISIKLALNANKTLWQIRKRALQILIIGIIIDIFIWQILPFQTYDVLYLIGLGTILITWIHTNKMGLNFIICCILFYLSYYLNDIYTFELTETPITNWAEINWDISHLKRLLLDGWFPLLPWLAIILAGYLSGSANFFPHYAYFFKFLSVVFLIIYILGFYVIKDIQPLRNNYSELFYPINYHFLIFLLAILCSIIFLINNNNFTINILAALGQYSLSIYLFHTILIKVFLINLSTTLEVIKWPSNLIFLFAIYFIAIIYSQFGSRIKKKLDGKYSNALRYLLGF
jgi:uncharacterized membrane protein